MPSEAIAPPLAALPRPWPCQIVRLLKDCPGQAKPGFGRQAAAAVARSVRHSSSARLRSGAGWHAEPSLSVACHAKPNAQGDCSPPRSVRRRRRGFGGPWISPVRSRTEGTSMPTADGASLCEGPGRRALPGRPPDAPTLRNSDDLGSGGSRIRAGAISPARAGDGPISGRTADASVRRAVESRFSARSGRRRLEQACGWPVKLPEIVTCAT